MSADNGIYILHTKDKWARIEPGLKRNYINNPINAYRIAHAQAIDNFNWYKENEEYNLGWYMNEIWGKSEVYYSLEDAILTAHKMTLKYPILEYGVSVIEATEYSFPM